MNDGAGLDKGVCDTPSDNSAHSSFGNPKVSGIGFKGGNPASEPPANAESVRYA
jgi:hypothetical protein